MHPVEEKETDKGNGDKTIKEAMVDRVPHGGKFPEGQPQGGKHHDEREKDDVGEPGDVEQQRVFPQIDLALALIKITAVDLAT